MSINAMLRLAGWFAAATLAATAGAILLLTAWHIADAIARKADEQMTARRTRRGLNQMRETERKNAEKIREWEEKR